MAVWPLPAGCASLGEAGVVVPVDVGPVDVVEPLPEPVGVPVDVPLEADPDEVPVEPDELPADPDEVVVDPDVVVVEPEVVVVPEDVVVELSAAAVWAEYGSRGAPPLEVALGAGVAVGVGVAVGYGSTVGSDCVWVRPPGCLDVSAAAVLPGVWPVVVIAERVSATLTAFVVCEPFLERAAFLGSPAFLALGATAERGCTAGAADGASGTTGDSGRATATATGAAATACEAAWRGPL